jgi:hypothetical protein
LGPKSTETKFRTLANSWLWHEQSRRSFLE